MSARPQSDFDGKAFAAQLSTAPGVYRMYAGDDTLLYVGKAGALRKRDGRSHAVFLLRAFMICGRLRMANLGITAAQRA